jgi:hypothetical protein
MNSPASKRVGNHVRLRRTFPSPAAIDEKSLGRIDCPPRKKIQAFQSNREALLGLRLDNLQPQWSILGSNESIITAQRSSYELYVWVRTSRPIRMFTRQRITYGSMMRAKPDDEHRDRSGRLLAPKTSATMKYRDRRNRISKDVDSS